MKIDFFARRGHYVEHMLPVWNALREEERGRFHVGSLEGGDSTLTPSPLPARERGGNPMLVCAYGDLVMAHRMNPKRKFAFMEHGVGITYGAHPAYAGGLGGARSEVRLFLAPNEIVMAKTEKALPGVKQVVVGTPKLDKWSNPDPGPFPSRERGKAVVAISFHWDGRKVAPEAGNAFEHFRGVLPELARQERFTLIGHGHPKGMEAFAKLYRALGIEVVMDFEEVMKRADLYVCDNSSTIYEYCVTGKPVVLLNAPQYRKKVHWGIRFWDYTDVGPMVDEPNELLSSIIHQLEFPEYFIVERNKAVRELYPFLGCSAERAAAALRNWYVS